MVVVTNFHALGGKLGGLRTSARHDSRIRTAPGRAAFLARFEHEVDPDGTLSPEERQRRAEAARRAFFAELALKSAQARSKRRAAS